MRIINLIKRNVLLSVLVCVNATIGSCKIYGNQGDISYLKLVFDIVINLFTILFFGGGVLGIIVFFLLKTTKYFAERNISESDVLIISFLAFNIICLYASMEGQNIIEILRFSSSDNFEEYDLK